MNLYEVIRRPIVTEKGVAKKEAERTLCFEVHQNANKTRFKGAVEKLFKVKVAEVRTANFEGKLRRRGRFAGYRSDWKKAYVRLKAGREDAGVRGDLEEGGTMPIKIYRPTTPTRRFQTVVSREEITKQTPEKSRWCEGKQAHRRPQQHGPGHDPVPRRRAQADLPRGRFQARQDGRSGARWRRSNTIRTVRRASRCCTTSDGEKRYILQPVGLEVGRTVVSRPEADILVGNALPLKNIPAGTIVHNIELRPGKGAQMARSAGARRSWFRAKADWRC